MKNSFSFFSVNCASSCTNLASSLCHLGHFSVLSFYICTVKINCGQRRKRRRPILWDFSLLSNAFLIIPQFHRNKRFVVIWNLKLNWRLKISLFGTELKQYFMPVDHLRLYTSVQPSTTPEVFRLRCVILKMSKLFS